MRTAGPQATSKPPNNPDEVTHIPALPELMLCPGSKTESSPMLVKLLMTPPLEPLKQKQTSEPGVSTQPRLDSFAGAMYTFPSHSELFLPHI